MHPGAWSPQPEKEEGLLRPYTPSPPVQVRVIAKGNVPKNRVQPGAGGVWPWCPMEESAGKQSPGELARECPVETTPGCHQSDVGSGLRLQLSYT